ncbi:hypothetical protein F0562_027443 [Nyssa sinensis]|uniref:AB hydrolase-1 domain-containing protein n=1 Tax=Nyssa sinensis TaxID=561372 RepID=A0A5J5B5N8_9ASTE|nr:hypothetical protein F0562_027443 [Nyssa sinensis]
MRRKYLKGLFNSLRDVIQDYDDSVGEIAHFDNSGNGGSLNSSAEQENGDYADQAAKTEEESSVTYETGRDHGTEVLPDHGTELEKDASGNTESLSWEELDRLVASRWTGENTGQQTGGVDAANDDDHKSHEERPKDPRFNVHYDKSGSKNVNSPPLLFLPGFGVGSFHYEKQLKDLGCDFGVWALDFLGQGMSLPFEDPTPRCKDRSMSEGEGLSGTYRGIAIEGIAFFSWQG